MENILYFNDTQSEFLAFYDDWHVNNNFSVRMSRKPTYKSINALIQSHLTFHNMQAKYMYDVLTMHQ
jgi:hypothetical protein